jgi:DNA-binding transcriptional regulator YdaS (Cro superfamily)
METDFPRPIKCLQAVEKLVGGRDRLAEELGVSKYAINRWVAERRISRNAIVSLVKLSEGKFTAEEFLGESIND